MGEKKGSVVQTYKYRAYPTDEVAEEARRQINLCRQVYNHALGLYHAAPDNDKPSYTELQNQLPDWKRRWPIWSDAYSKCLQMAVRRLYESREVLATLRQQGYNVGELRWKSPREYRSIVFNQFGFDVDCNTGRADHAILSLSKIGDIELKYHRELPADAHIKQVVLKEEKSGKWHASVVVEYDPDYPSKPPVEAIEPDDTTGIDLGIMKLVHDSNGRGIKPLDETEERRRIEKLHRTLSRKTKGSNNWERARRKLASAYEKLANRRKDLREKLAHSYTKENDVVFLEDLDVRNLLELDRNGSNIASMSWRKLIVAFRRHGDKNGCHVVTVPPAWTSKRCARCGVETEKSVWVRKHSCPSCGFETDRDQNSALEIKRLGLVELGIVSGSEGRLGLGEAEGTPGETVLPTDTVTVSAKHVVESGSHASTGAS